MDLLRKTMHCYWILEIPILQNLYILSFYVMLNLSFIKYCKATKNVVEYTKTFSIEASEFIHKNSWVLNFTTTACITTIPQSNFNFNSWNVWCENYFHHINISLLFFHFLIDDKIIKICLFIIPLFIHCKNSLWKSGLFR